VETQVVEKEAKDFVEPYFIHAKAYQNKHNQSKESNKSKFEVC